MVQKWEILETGDVSEKEALQYLKLWEVDGGQAEQIYRLIGGRMVSLKETAEKIRLYSKTLPGMHSMLYNV